MSSGVKLQLRRKKIKIKIIDKKKTRRKGGRVVIVVMVKQSEQKKGRLTIGQREHKYLDKKHVENKRKRK